jgi:hypothetical protein
VLKSDRCDPCDLALRSIPLETLQRTCSAISSRCVAQAREALEQQRMKTARPWDATLLEAATFCRAEPYCLGAK